MSTEYTLSPAQFEKFLSIANSIESLRSLSEEEKEALIYKIHSTPYIDLMCDWAFKHVFGHNEENLKMLLNDLLPEKIEHIEYESNELDPFKGDDKQVIMDVLCHTQTGKFVVEMQKAKNDEFRNRMLYYGAASIYKQLKKGDNYNKLVPVYVICFMNFRLHHKTNQLVYRYQVREQDTSELYGNQLSLYFCELPRFIRPKKNMSPVEEWFDLLRNMHNFAVNPDHINKRFHSILDACYQPGLNDLEQTQYLRAMLTEDEKQSIGRAYYEDGFLDGMEQGETKGRAEGKAEALRETARTLRKMNLSIADIAKATGLSVQEIEAL